MPATCLNAYGCMHGMFVSPRPDPGLSRLPHHVAAACIESGMICKHSLFTCTGIDSMLLPCGHSNLKPDSMLTIAAIKESGRI